MVRQAHHERLNSTLLNPDEARRVQSGFCLASPGLRRRTAPSGLLAGGRRTPDKAAALPEIEILRIPQDGGIWSILRRYTTHGRLRFTAKPDSRAENPLPPITFLPNWSHCLPAPCGFPAKRPLVSLMT